MRHSSVDFEYYMRNNAAKRLREGSEGKEVRFDADSATVTLSQSSDILGVGLEDAVEIILE